MTQPLTEHDPGPVPPDALIDGPATVRARQVAAIHALAQFYADHPEVPMPTNIVAASYSRPPNPLDQADMIAETISLSDRYSGKLSEDRNGVECRIELTEQDGMPVILLHRVSLPAPEPRRLTSVQRNFASTRTD